MEELLNTNESQTLMPELNGSTTLYPVASGSIPTTTRPNTSFLGVAYLILGVLVMASNGTVVYVIVKSKELHLTPLWIIAFMALCDFCFGCFVFTFYMPAAILWRFPYPDSLKLVSFCIHSFLLGQTLFNIALANIDRYIAIGWPMIYPRIVTTKRLIALILILVIFGCFRITMIFMTNAKPYYDANIGMSIPAYVPSPTAMTVRTIAVLAVPLVTLVVIFFCIFRICVLSRLSRSSKFPWMTLIMTSVYLLSYVPQTSGIVLLIRGYDTNNLTGFIQLSLVAMFTNSLWNVLIYTVTYTPFKEGLTKTFCYRYHRRLRQKHVVKMLVATRHH